MSLYMIQAVATLLWHLPAAAPARALPTTRRILRLTKNRLITNPNLYTDQQLWMARWQLTTAAYMHLTHQHASLISRSLWSNLRMDLTVSMASLVCLQLLSTTDLLIFGHFTLKERSPALKQLFGSTIPIHLHTSPSGALQQIQPLATSLSNQSSLATTPGGRCDCLMSRWTAVRLKNLGASMQS